MLPADTPEPSGWTQAGPRWGVLGDPESRQTRDHIRGLFLFISAAEVGDNGCFVGTLLLWEDHGFYADLQVQEEELASKSSVKLPQRFVELPINRPQPVIKLQSARP